MDQTSIPMQYFIPTPSTHIIIRLTSLNDLKYQGSLSICFPKWLVFKSGRRGRSKENLSGRSRQEKYQTSNTWELDSTITRQFKNLCLNAHMNRFGRIRNTDIDFVLDQCNMLDQVQSLGEKKYKKGKKKKMVIGLKE